MRNQQETALSRERPPTHEFFDRAPVDLLIDAQTFAVSEARR